jgi:hypothetical protein
MTDPAGSDRLQQDIPTGSGSGDNNDLGSFDDVPLTPEEAVERDASRPDEQPAKPGSEPSLARRAAADDREVQP